MRKEKDGCGEILLRKDRGTKKTGAISEGLTR